MNLCQNEVSHDDHNQFSSDPDRLFRRVYPEKE
jgi:hypothetical protein